MLLRDRILAVIGSQPGGVGLQLIRAHVHDVSNAAVANALSDLYGEGSVERIGHARYRLPAPKVRVTPPVVATGDFIQRPTLARLMAGR